jgi:sphinganine-1-phosphate aldolase
VPDHYRPTIPETGRDRAELLAEMRAMKEHDADWHGGRTFSLVYHADDEHTAFLKDVYAEFFSENALNPVAFGSLRRFEAEVVAMASDLLGGDERTAGTMSSGGSESILLAVKTYRDQARAERGITEPELVLPRSAHPAFLKSCHYVGVTPVLTPLAEDLRADVDAVRGAVTDRTIAVVGSAPGYPHGVVDPIEELAAIAAETGCGMHVDACLGGFLLPWLRDLGAPIPPFDLSVPGVTSLSADVHKYGFAAKGASVVLYRDAGLRRHQFHVATGWPGGIYISPTAAGTRPGGAIAAAWAALQAIGADGYREIAATILDTATRLRKGIDGIEGLHVLGDPPASAIAFGSDEVDVYAVADVLEQRGWHVDRQIDPACLHVLVTPVHAPVVDDLVDDLGAAVSAVRADPSLSTQGQAAMYGMMATLPEGDGQVDDFLLAVLDGLYTV